MLSWALKRLFGTSTDREIRKIRPHVDQINALEAKIAPLSDSELRAKTAEFKQKLENGASLDDIMHEAFAVCREGGKRALKMRHFDVQLIGGIALHRGNIAEMRTGEGKTLVATLPCYLNALEGKGVHVITVNDYLARRDSEWMGRLYGFLGLSTGVVVHSQEDSEKRRAYQSDITYGQNNEFGFDYLRDNMKFSALDYFQRELNYAIVDEVDSILIDEARTPLIISGNKETSSGKYMTINDVVPRLKKDEHYAVDEKAHSVSLTDEGVDLSQRLMGIQNLYDPVNLESLHILNQCLKAHTLYRRDVHYLVTEDGKVMIIDEFTGRVLPGRRWSDGLHQAVEAKENVPIQEESRTMATITFQNLFRIYKKLSGMTGTAETEAAEFYSTYKLNVISIPTNKNGKRVDYNDLVYKTENEKFAAVTAELLEFHEKGQPVLVGTTSVEKSNAIARILKKRSIPHAVLNAKQHEKEAFVVAQAGRRGAITVSTNMAGRGTDILLGGNAEMLAKLDFKEQGRDADVEPEAFQEVVKKYEESCKKEGEEIRELGGLHIIGTERHESRRIDNQLRGRAGRQGDTGSSRFYLSLEDDLMRIFGGDRVKQLMERMGMPDDEPIEHPWVNRSISDAQTKVEARNFDQRKNLLEYDDVMNEQRKTVYRIRQQLLLGRYLPEYLDDEGKATGKLREIAPLARLLDVTKETIEQIVKQHGVPKSIADGADAAGGFRQGVIAKTVEEVDHFENFDALRLDVYQIWGYRFDATETEIKNPKAIYERLLKEIPQSLTEQRERLLDLADGMIGAMVEECCPFNKSPEDWKWDEINAGFREYIGEKPHEIEHVSDPEDLAQKLYAQVEGIIAKKEEEMGTELLMRVFRHFYLEEIDRAWVEHLTNMENLRDGIGLRGYGQRDPKQEYKKEGYDLFVNMMSATNGVVLGKAMSVNIDREAQIAEIEQADLARHREMAENLQAVHVGESLPPPPEDAVPQRVSQRPQPKLQQRREDPAVNRNELCPCGSGQKFKQCHGAALEDGA